MPTASLNVAPLNDNEPWFANAAAWSNYWAQVVLTVDVINNALYAEVANNVNLLSPQIMDDQGTLWSLCTQQMYDNLRARYDQLNTSYKLLRDELKAAGYTANSQ